MTDPDLERIAARLVAALVPFQITARRHPTLAEALEALGAVSDYALALESPPSPPPRPGESTSETYQTPFGDLPAFEVDLSYDPALAPPRAIRPDNDEGKIPSDEDEIVIPRERLIGEVELAFAASIGEHFRSRSLHLRSDRRELAEIAVDAIARVPGTMEADAADYASRTYPKLTRWPFVETPGEFAGRLWGAYCGKHSAPDSVLAAVRTVLIEQPPALSPEYHALVLGRMLGGAEIRGAALKELRRAIDRARVDFVSKNFNVGGGGIWKARNEYDEGLEQGLILAQEIVDEMLKPTEGT